MHTGGANNMTSLREIAQIANVDLSEESSKFDLIIDDGSHASIHHIVTLDSLYPCLKNGGIYVIEDMGAPAWVDELDKP